MDAWFSLKLHERHSFHWERRAIDGTIYRHDNAPHRRWHDVATFPRHVHNGSETDVAERYLSEAPEQALRNSWRLHETGWVLHPAEKPGGDTDEMWLIYRLESSSSPRDSTP